MIVRDAKDIARDWVAAQAREIADFRGAYFAGSALSMPDDVELPSSSDIDVWIAVAPADLPRGGKRLYKGVLLDASYAQLDQLGPAERILGDYHIAVSFAAEGGIIADPTGVLRELHDAVSRQFARANWVRKRCDDALGRSLRNARSLDASQPLHDQVTSWLFATGVSVHVLLVAGLQNPTVRRRYEVARDLLSGYGQSHVYGTLLEMLGCAHMSAGRVDHHLRSLSGAFDAAAVAAKTPFPFVRDISEMARPVAIGGSRELIDAGLHREAIFWMVATYARCQNILLHDAAPAAYEEHALGFRALLAELGIASFDELERRCALVEQFLPHVSDVADAIIAANPGVEE